MLRAECIAELRAQGHEIGYHYETLSKARGDLDRAVELFGRELARLRELAPVRVASMHGSPLLPWDNRQIWSRVRPEDFGLLGEAYQAVDGRQVHYFSDTGRTWHPTRFNIRDRSVAAQGPVVESSDQLIELIRAKRCPGLCLLTHAERWSATPSAWAVRAVRDGVENLGKLTLARAYSVWRALQPRPRP